MPHSSLRTLPFPFPSYPTLTFSSHFPSPFPAHAILTLPLTFPFTSSHLPFPSYPTTLSSHPSLTLPFTLYPYYPFLNLSLHTLPSPLPVLSSPHHSPLPHKIFQPPHFIADSLPGISLPLTLSPSPAPLPTHALPSTHRIRPLPCFIPDSFPAPANPRISTQIYKSLDTGNATIKFPYRSPVSAPAYRLISSV